MAYNGKILSLVLLFSLILPTESCIELISPNLNENDSEPMLVVAGQITNEEGPFKVKLTTSVPVNVMYYPNPVLGADIRIIDDQGNAFLLYGDDNGWYETADKKLKGIPGNTYTLFVTSTGGMQYESSPVLMEEVPDIDSIYFEEVKRTKFEGGQTYEDNWLNILIDAHDPEGKIKYWNFDFEETWEVMMLTDNVPVEHTPGLPGSITLEKVVVSDEKKVCWVKMPSNSILVANTVNSPLDEIKRFPLKSIGPDENRLHIRYSILVKQSSISYELYNFRKKLRDTNENLGSIYDKIPARVFGNITCCNGTSKALGYFSASAIRKKRIFINKSEHHVATVSAYKGCSYFDYSMPQWVPKSFFGTIEGTETQVYCHTDFCADCRNYGTNIKPDYWD